MKPIEEFEKKVLESLVAKGLIPIERFDITEHHINAYMQEYVDVFDKTPCVLKTGDYRFIRKLSAMTLVKYASQFVNKPSMLKCGFVYMIKNPVYPDHYKVGMTVDVESRLKQYQTYDPFKQFSVKRYEFVLDRRETERMILGHELISLENGEWVHKKRAEHIFGKLSSSYKRVLAKDKLGAKPIIVSVSKSKQHKSRTFLIK